ncbi:hypothetical protein OIU78_024251 [Salix suchowensis]|nr:hypothetical protein OIU78_024251 [Salix suchowensis]
MGFTFCNRVLDLRQWRLRWGVFCLKDAGFSLTAMSFHVFFVSQLDEIENTGPTMAGRGPEEVRVVLSPHRICPLGAHIDHQGGTVSAMTINEGILLGFIHSVDAEVKGPVPFSHSLMNQRGD